MVEGAASRVEKMIVHSDESGQSRVAGEVHDFGLGWNCDGTAGSNRGDLSIGNEYGLVSFGRRAGAVNHTHVLQCDHGSLRADKVFNLRLSWLCQCRSRKHDSSDKPDK